MEAERLLGGHCRGLGQQGELGLKIMNYYSLPGTEASQGIQDI